MTVEKKTNYGSITVSEEAVATLAGGVITECYGVVGMASRKALKDGFAELLKMENYSKEQKNNKVMIFLEVNLKSIKKVEQLINQYDNKAFVIISDTKKVYNGKLK